MTNFLRKLNLTRLIALLTFIAIFVMAVRAPLDTDTLWHLRAGEWQWQHHSLLNVDEFSHTRAGEPWINHSWLSQFVIYGSYLALGDAGLALYTALLATAGLIFVYLQCDGDPLVRAAVTILSGVAAAVFWTPRPQMMSFFFSTVVLYLLWLYRARGTDRLWFIPPLMMIWANFHGGFAIGFILMVLVTIGEFLHWFVHRVLPTSADDPPDDDPPTLKPVVRLIVIGLVSAAAISINPYGPSMLFYPFRTIGIGVLQDFIQEWASPDFHMVQTWPFIWLLIGTPIMAAISPKRLDWRDLILLSGTAYSALLAGRNIATFAIVAAPILSIHADAWLKEHGYHLKWGRIPTSGLFIAVNWILLLLVIAAGVVKIVYALDPEPADEVRQATLPIDAVDYLEEATPPGPIFNSYNWGGYLIWTARDYPVYVDGRTDLYDDELLRVYLDIYFAQPGWEEKLDEAGINLVLVESSSPLAQVLSLTDGWTQDYADDVASVFVRE